jgi:hypothetical protein
MGFIILCDCCPVLSNPKGDERSGIEKPDREEFVTEQLSSTAEFR